MTKLPLTERDWVTGAIYRFGLKRHLDREALAELITARVGFKPSTATAIAGHWVNSGPYRAMRETEARS
ncbi:MAG: hypothetical protein KGL39_59795 [Patescibacteria group bacterium]|nr:hypothetical protein [Patescibacteria group bacterium]